MFAAHAVIMWGLDPVIFSKRTDQPSEMFGAQYLHEPIPELSDAHMPFTVAYRLNGTPAQYAEKVYGLTPVDFVSPEKYLGVRLAWDIRQAYHRAWEAYHPDLMPADITPTWVADRRDWWRDDFRFVVNTIPLPAVCADPTHRFEARDVWASGDAPERDKNAAFSSELNTVTCDGTKDRSWYRAANIQGLNTVEWALPEDNKPPYSNVARLVKPVRTNCTCWSEFMIRAGRYGTWTKGELSHQAFLRTNEKLEATR
jgi:hypothetical protein